VARSRIQLVTNLITGLVFSSLRGPGGVRILMVRVRQLAILFNPRRLNEPYSYIVPQKLNCRQEMLQISHFPPGLLYGASAWREATSNSASCSGFLIYWYLCWFGAYGADCRHSRHTITNKLTDTPKGSRQWKSVPECSVGQFSINTSEQYNKSISYAGWEGCSNPRTAALEKGTATGASLQPCFCCCICHYHDVRQARFILRCIWEPCVQTLRFLQMPRGKMDIFSSHHLSNRFEIGCWYSCSTTNWYTSYGWTTQETDCKCWSTKFLF